MDYINRYTSAPCEWIFYNNGTLVVDAMSLALSKVVPMPSSFKNILVRKTVGALWNPNEQTYGPITEFVYQFGGDYVQVGKRNGYRDGIDGVQYKLTRDYDFSIDLVENGYEVMNVFLFKNDGFLLGMIDDLVEYVEKKENVDIDLDDIEDVVLVIKQTGNYVKDEFFGYIADWIAGWFADIDFDELGDFFRVVAEKFREWF